MRRTWIVWWVAGMGCVAASTALDDAVTDTSGSSDVSTHGEPSADPGEHEQTGTAGSTSSGESGNVASSSESAGNLPPTAVELSSPAAGAIDVPVTMELCWNASIDPEGGPVRYRVYVDDMELTNGKLSEPGFSGTCTPPLSFVHDRAYRWHVVAFDANMPSSMSSSSERWTFTTEAGDGKVVFEDDFSGDLGWTVLGNASSGAWVHGDPERTDQRIGADNWLLAQPESCATGSGCWFTGRNPDHDPSMDDVDGGSTVLVSPKFDISSGSSVSVSWNRFFYHTPKQGTGHGLLVELSIPSPVDDKERVMVLEELAGEQAHGANTWTPVTYAVCGVELTPDATLRITATDLTNDVVEAAIDDVVVRTHVSSDLCDGAKGSICHPDIPVSCSAGLSCCPQGALDQGIYRCSDPVAALDPASPPASPDAPNNGAMGCDAADLVPELPSEHVYVEDVFVEQNACALLEGCVAEAGWRTVLRFDMRTKNIGSNDLILGVPANHPALFHYSECHSHYHFDGFASYSLLTADRSIAASGHKQAYCLIDWDSWAWPWLDGQSVDGSDGTYSCYNQGIGRGWADLYEHDFECQWIDVTHVPPGEYLLHVEINPQQTGSNAHTLIERDYGNNVAELTVTLP